MAIACAIYLSCLYLNFRGPLPVGEKARNIPRKIYLQLQENNLHEVFCVQKI